MIWFLISLAVNYIVFRQFMAPDDLALHFARMKDKRLACLRLNRRFYGEDLTPAKVQMVSTRTPTRMEVLYYLIRWYFFLDLPWLVSPLRRTIMGKHSKWTNRWAIFHMMSKWERQFVQLHGHSLYRVLCVRKPRHSARYLRGSVRSRTRG